MNNAGAMAGMNAMGGPVGGGMPAMNNGIPGGPHPGQEAGQHHKQLNTYIYEYFLRNEMYDCARALCESDQPMNLKKASPRGQNGLGNGVNDEMEDIKDDLDSKRPNDLPLPNLPNTPSESCFLFEWWCLFWDMFNAHRGKGDRPQVGQYIAHTQMNSRMKQEQQQQMLRQMRPEMNQYQMMMRNQQKNGLSMAQNDLARQAMQNNGRNITPQHMQMIQKQQQMQRDGSDMDGNRQRPQSPGSAENEPSPSKRQRMDGGPMNIQPGMMPSGRGQPQGMQGQQVGPNAMQASQMLITNGINPSTLTAAQFNAFQKQTPNGQQASIQQYSATLAQQHQNAMNSKGIAGQAGGPGNGGSPMMPQGQDVNAFYNGTEMGPGGIRPGPGGQPGGNGTHAPGNHALQDYQMQLMLLEQQNKKRLMMARQEQDNMTNPREGGPPGQNGQPFQQGASPQGAPRSSPNPNDQMKRGTPQLNATGIPSPLPDGQNRGSPSASMGFMPGQMEPSMAPHFYKPANGMDANMMAGMPNGMRPPSSHPGFNAPMTQQQQQQQMMAARNQAAANGQMPNWQQQPNGAPMMQQQPSQGPPPQSMGTPQQRAMPPPQPPNAGAAPGANPAAAAAAANRTQPSSPQQNPAPPTPSQANKANPKAAKKDTKERKRPTKKPSNAAINSGATPSNEGAAEPATPTPATPITPQHPASFNNKNGQTSNPQQPTANGQPASAAPQPAPLTAPQAADPAANNYSNLDDPNMGFNINMDFSNPNMGGDVLQDFDFDSFLHNDAGDVDSFAFDANTFMDTGEIGAE